MSTRRNLSAHLQSPDFFDAEQYPELRFTADDIRLDGDGQVSVVGELTIKGVTQPVTVTGTVTAPMADRLRDTSASAST